MIRIPATAHEILGDDGPRIGSPEEPTVIARHLVTARSGVEDCGSRLQQASSALAQARSEALGAVTARIGDRVSTGARALQQSLDTAVRAFERYAAAVDEIHRAALRVGDRVDGCLAVMRAQLRTLEWIAGECGVWLDFGWRPGPPLALPAGRTSALDLPGAEVAAALEAHARNQQLWAIAAARWREAGDGIDDALIEWRRLHTERCAAEHALLGALGDTALGQLIAVGEATRAGRRSSVAFGLTGQLWGEFRPPVSLATTHPLLERLIGDVRGADTWQRPPASEIVARNWAALSPFQQQRLIAEVPLVIGNLPGVPYPVRNEANRRLLMHYAVHREGLSAECVELLGELALVLAENPAGPPISIVALDLSGEVPMLALGYGDLEHSTSLTWQVPGMASDAHAALSTWNTASRNLQSQQEQLLVGAASGSAAGAAAVIAFLAYDTPDLVTVLSARSARVGSRRLAAELDGATAARRRTTPLATHAVVAHSYGTPVAANALIRTREPVQSFTMLGSAGLDDEWIRSLEQLHVERDAAGHPRVFTTMAPGDGLAPIGARLAGRLQPNPRAVLPGGTGIAGAHVFDSGGRGRLLATDGHSVIGEGTRDPLGTHASAGRGYLDAQTQSLRAVAAISLGVTEQVPGGIGR